MATAKKAPAKNATPAPAKRSVTKKAGAEPAPAATPAAPARSSKATTPTSTKATPKSTVTTPTRTTPAATTPAPAKAASKSSKAAAAPSAPAAPAAADGTPFPPVKGVTKEGISYTKDFDAKFLTSQRALLLREREELTGQAVQLENEANQIIEEQEMGDVQFDDEGGEGDTMVVERERDLAISAQARGLIADIDAALIRLELGTYGYSVESGRPISRERLEAIPWASVLVEEKVGGIGRR